MKHYILLLFTTTFLLFFTGCSTKLEKLNNVSQAFVQEVDFDELDGFYDDDLSLALEVFKKDCHGSKRFKMFKNICQKAQVSNDAEAFFTSNFSAYKLLNNNGLDKGVITGYYEPLLHGSLTKSKEFAYAIYKTPKDMITVDLSKVYPALKKYRLRGKIVGNKLIPYESRKDMLKNKNLEPICYVNSKVDLFFLQIQGSGKVQLEDGTILNIAYANQNGRRYKSVGKYMLKKGYIGNTTASLQGMKEFFAKNPDKVDEILNHNDSYVFFRNSKKGASGSLGTQLTAKRNLAVDRKYIPLGMPVFISTSNPVTRTKINQLMVAADTGGAIKGEIRADFFWGYGQEALKYAGKMKEQGKLYILVPKE